MASFARTQELEHAIGPAGHVTLRVTTSDTELRRTDGDRAKVRVEFEIRAADDREADEIFDRVRFRVGQGDGSLEVAEPKRADDGLGSLARILGMGGDRVAARVVAELPAETALTYTGVSGELLVSGLGGAQEYKTVSGDCVLADAAGSIRISSVSGDVSLRAVGPVGLQASTVSGDVSAFAPRFDRLRVVTVSGDIELEGELSEDGDQRAETLSGDLSLGLVGDLTLEVRGLSSDVEISLPHRSEGSRDRRRYVIGEGRPMLLFSSMSGDVSVGSARRFGDSPPAVPEPPRPPVGPTPPPPPPPIDDAAQLAVLRALEAGEIDVDEAARRLGEAADG